ncbi:hypothetical protein EV702DRAFT_1048913 [Suillus placidus]|uniref:Uncharacterized protein n=1 Tax=Suillus placidus TaxID=48579 RepID=A0A9P6ZM73_9AGAM|nr:hypothetical protein EV702DRAFT_1048913 [Suillus placidus]
MTCPLQEQSFILLYQMKEWSQKLNIKLDKVYAPKKGHKGVDDNDLWYGIIQCFRVDKHPKASQPFWVKICWYWSKDLEEDYFKSASQSDSRFFSMGSHELLQSDLTQWSEASILADTIKVVKFDENSGSQKPWG